MKSSGKGNIGGDRKNLATSIGLYSRGMVGFNTLPGEDQRRKVNLDLRVGNKYAAKALEDFEEL